jgi:hypothetical protein
MKPHLSDLYKWTGTIHRGPFLFWGTILTILKFNLDRWTLISHLGQHVWYPWSYWIPGDVFGVLSSAPERKEVARLLVLIALPFVYMGVVLTVRRLRALGWPLALVILFFIPVVNLLFFALLVVLPSRPATEFPADPAVARRLFIVRLVPESGMGAAVSAILITALLGAGMVYVFTIILSSYGWGIFLGIPFFLGLFSTLVFTVRGARPFKECASVATLSVIVLSGILLGLALEGFICILMAAPIGILLALLGALVGHLIVSVKTAGRERAMMLWMLVLLTPGLLAAEASHPPGPAVYSAIDRIVVDAPAPQVWDTLKAIDTLTVPKPLLLRMGLPVPVRCTLEREGVGARRTCIFEKGTIDERVLEWEPPRRMRLEIVRSTLPGRHWLGFREAIYELDSEAGRTRITRTTTYTSILEPRWYWGALEKFGLSSMHSYVLEDLQARFNKHVPAAAK